jgi:hypothetical protein
MRTAVVLPAPLGPSTASTVPVRAVRSTPSSAVVAPKRLTRPRASMVLSMMLLGVGFVPGSSLDRPADTPVTSG